MIPSSGLIMRGSHYTFSREKQRRFIWSHQRKIRNVNSRAALPLVEYLENYKSHLNPLDSVTEPDPYGTLSSNRWHNSQTENLQVCSR